MQIRLSLQNKIFLSAFSVVTLGLLLVAAAYNTITTRVNTGEALRASRRELALITNNLDATLTHIGDYAISIAVDERVIAALKRNPSLPADESLKYELRQQMNRSVSTIMGLNRNVYQWDLITLDQSLAGASGYDMSAVAPLLSPELFDLLAGGYGVTVTGPYVLEEKTGAVPSFFVSKAIIDLDSRKLCGYLIFVVRESSFSAIFENNMPQREGASFYVLDEAGTVVSSTDGERFRSNFFETSGLTLQQYTTLEQERSVSAKIDGTELLFAMANSTSGKVHWTVVSCTPLSALMTGQSIINRFIIGAGIVACLFVLLASLAISRSISRPIHTLAQTISEAAEGDWKTVDRSDSGEVEILYSGFNHLMSRVKTLMEEIYHEQEEKNEYQFRLLQSQIKPHFLYNTLQTIKALIDLGMNDTAGECTAAMSTFYRISLSRGAEIISLGEEGELIRQYLYIQKLRYADTLDYSFEIPVTLQQYLLPKMTLQPILENAIYHGIKEKGIGGFIAVSAEENEDTITVNIRDNGVGIEHQTLSALRGMLARADTEPRHTRPDSFGLVSIHRRIRLLMGNKCGVMVDSEPGVYTAVTVTIRKTIHHGLKEADKHEQDGIDRGG